MLNRNEPANRLDAATSEVETGVEERPNVEPQIVPGPVEAVVAPAAIERALSIYQQLHPRDHSVVVQARKILTQQIFGMVDQGEQVEQRLVVGGLAHLKAIERDHAIKSAERDHALKPARGVKSTGPRRATRRG
jgi:hypothetical protein